MQLIYFHDEMKIVLEEIEYFMTHSTNAHVIKP